MKARSSSVEVPTAQPHLSRIVRIVNLGLQPGFEWAGEVIEPDYKIEFTFEVCDENMRDGRPFFVSKEVNNKDSDKATLYLWMTAVGESCNNIDKSLGKAVMMTPKIKKSGWPTVETVAGLPAVMQSSVAELVNEPVFFDFTEDEPDMETWDKLYDKEKDKIMKALDFQEYPIYARLAERGEV
jgi:hypothetical protein